MGKLARKTSQAAELADERFSEAAVSGEKYPSGASFIGADEPHFGAVLAEAVAAQQALVIVYDDGKELVGTPSQGTLNFTINSPTLSDSERLKRSYAHPARAQLIVLFQEERTVSPNEAAKELGLSLGNTAYHFKSLLEYGAIELTRSEQRRGAVEHFYRATNLLRVPREEQG